MSLRLCFVPAVILSALVPICSSRQRTKSKGYRAPKRGAEEDHLDSPDSRRSKRGLADDGLEGASASPTAALSAEELFKLKNSGEFDINDEEKDKHVEVKDEPTGDSGHTSHARKQLSSITVPPTASVHHARSSSVHSPARNVFGDHSTQIVKREDLLDNLLSQNFSTEMTGYAVQQILQDAKHSAGTGNELGVAYVEARIDRLQQKGITSARLEEVLHLFQTNLRDDLDQLSSRTESIGSISTPPNTSSARTTQHAPDQDKHLHVNGNSSMKRTQRGTIVAKADQKPAINSPRTRLAAFEASHPQSDSSDSSSNEDDDNESNSRKSRECNSRYLADDNEDHIDYLDGDRSELTEEETMNTIKRKDNLRLYGWLRPKATFDIYARCAISACMSGPGDANNAIDIRDQALRVWRAMSRSDKVEWDHLFEIRHSNVDIFKKGHELLRGQGMLAKLKPDYNTAPDP